MNLAAVLQRRIERGFDPVAIFRELCDIPAVSFTEYLMFRYLVAEFRRLRTELPAGAAERFSIDFSPMGQLRVRWQGQPDDRRKTILVAHVDREGFLVTGVDRAAARAYCWHTAGASLEPHEIGRRVALACDDMEIRGTILSSAEKSERPSCDKPFDHVVEVRIDEAGPPTGRQIERNDYFRGTGHYDLPLWQHQDGVIATPSVDDAAGVSVLVALMTAVARRQWRVNVECLFTTCEESGFCGAVDEILGGTAFQQDADEAICIVVDSSSHLGLIEDAGLWNPEPAVEPDMSRAVEIPLQIPVIRTGDVRCGYDHDVVRMLRAAAGNLAAAAEQRDWIPPRSRPSQADELRNVFDPAGRAGAAGVAPRTGRKRALVGRMVGGWCEATPLMLANQIRRRKGLDPLKLRVGSVAIPVGGFRNSFNNDLQPEKCHEEALRSTCQILGEAIRLCHRWSFDETGSHTSLPANADEIVDELLDWHERFKGISAVTRQHFTQSVESGVM